MCVFHAETALTLGQFRREKIEVNIYFSSPGNFEWLLTDVEDWGTLRRKNPNPQNIYLNFEIKHFDGRYGYSIQCGIFEQEMGIFRNV